MWQARSLLMRSITAARVVDLPEPVGPVTEHEPLMLAGEVGEHRVQVQLLHKSARCGDHPWCTGGASRVAEKRFPADACAVTSQLKEKSSRAGRQMRPPVPDSGVTRASARVVMGG